MQDLAELMLDFDEETKPGTPSGIRLRKDFCETHGLAEIAEKHRAAVERMNTVMTRRLEEAFATTRDELRSWLHCPPTDDVRAAVVERLNSLIAQTLSLLTRER